LPGGDDPQAIRTRITYRKQRIDEDCFEIAKDLWKVYHRKLYIGFGYESFEDYVTGPEVSYSLDKATRMRRLWSRLILDMGLRPKELAGVTYTNANMILPYLHTAKEQGRMEELLEAARTSSVRQLEPIVEGFRHPRPALPAPDPDSPTVEVEGSPRFPPAAGVAAPPPNKPARRSFVLFAEQITVVDEALAEAARIAKSEKPGHLLTCVATEFLASRMTREGKDDGRLRFYMRHLERIYGGKIVHIKDPKGFEVLRQAIEQHPELLELSDKEPI